MSLKTNLPEKLRGRINRGTITKQKLWKFIRELNSFSEERLDAIALISDGKRISYREMFEAWEQYAKAFSGIGITETNNSRVGFLSGRDLESVYSLYGLNMTGTSVSLLHELDILDSKRWDQLITKEGITDLLLTDRKLSLRRLLFITENKERLGIRNVIILHGSQEKDENYHRLKKTEGVLFLDELLDEYAENDISYGTDKTRDDAVIFHTSGTTSGIHKPVPMSDRGFNESAARLIRDKRFNKIENVVSTLSVELTAAYGTCDMLHLPLSYGGTVVLMPDGAGERQMLQAIEKYKVSILFGLKDLFEMLADVSPRPDLSSLEFVFLGGSYVSADAKQRYCDFLKECGSDGQIFVGYGMTETGGAVILADGDCFEDSIGKPLSGVKAKILDENDGKYYELSDGKRTGVLCLSSPSVSSGTLNGQQFFELTDIDGDSYLNTYDLVEVAKDGSLRIVGRMNKFFVNNEGIRFDAGIIETAVSSEPDIAACGLVPEYNKQIHDTIPVLFIQFAKSPDKDTDGKNKRLLTEDMLFRIFVKEDRIKETNLPAMVVICKELPLNRMGKVDVQRIAKGETKGKRYVVKPVRRHGQLIDVRVISRGDAGIYLNGGIPEELEYDMELYKMLIEGRETDMRRGRKYEPIFVKVLKRFMEEMEEEQSGRIRRRESEDMDDIYAGFGNRYDDEDDDDDYDDKAVDDCDEDDDSDDASGRGCAPSDEKKDPMEMLSKLGRYFSASDYDEDYEE